MWMFPAFFVRVLFGPRYAAAADGVRPIVLVGVALALILLVCTFSTAIADHSWFRVLLGAAVAQTTAIIAIHETPATIA